MISPSRPPGFRGEWSTDRVRLRAVATASGVLETDPRALAVPVDEADAATLVRWAARRELPLIPRGAGTGMPGGNVGDGVILDLATNFRGRARIDPQGRRAIVGPGITLGQLNESAARHGLRFPVDPSSGERCTLGGMAANNAAGARSIRFGATRRWVRSLRLLGSDGAPTASRREGGSSGGILAAGLGELRSRFSPEADRIEREWPAVRKNSSGYAIREFLAGDDLDLLIGSEGTLGLITELELELAPLPGVTGLVLIELPSLEAVPEAVARLRPLAVSTCEMLDRTFLSLVEDGGASPVPLHPEVEAVLLVDVEADARDTLTRELARVDDAVSEIALRVRLAPTVDRRADLWRLRTAASPLIAERAGGRRSMQFIEDSVVPVDALPAYIRALRDVLDRHHLPAVIFGHAGDGNLHVNPLVDVRRDDWKETVAEVLDEMSRVVADLGGTLAGEHGDGRLRAPLLERIWGADMMARFRIVKQTLDPRGILNPGVIIPLPGQGPLDLLS